MTDAGWTGLVGELLSPAAPDLVPGKWLYSVSTEDVVLYVGRATKPLRRLRQHLVPPGCIAWQPSALTELALDYWAEALTWRVTIWPIPEDLAEAEAAAIRELRPCLNRQHNDNGHELPERLMVMRRQRDAERLARFRDRPAWTA